MRLVRGTRWAPLIMLVVAVCLCVVALLRMVVRVAPAGTRTRAEFFQAHKQITDFTQRSDRLPTSLSEAAGDAKDEWGRPIQMTTSVDGDVTLVSLGRDGTAGGTGADADIAGTFSLRRVGGRWRAGDPFDFTGSPSP